MKHPIFKSTACALLLVPLISVQADTFGSGSNAFTINFVTIGNAGNGNDRALDNTNNTPGNPSDDEYASPLGGVAYVFRMGVTEVPQDWIDKATNLGLTGVTAGAWTGMQPATSVYWYEAAAFVNWLNTSTGHQAAYQLSNGNTTPMLWTSAQAWQAGGENLYRHKDAYYFLPSDDEWYKAAYHKNDGVTANYWDYATGSNLVPTAVTSGTGIGTAVYNNNNFNSFPAAVDNSGGLSAYGTRGQGGNVDEWQESADDGINDSASEARGHRGGDWQFPESQLRSSFSDGDAPGSADEDLGFRIASVPEPSSAALILSAVMPALLQRRRRLSA